ncbi:MAG TPA: SH3 domain-containing protein [Acidobacteriaceae bacterium]|nr:SH3 domain-containing protein [Acidobacteriaceae bacterium]
MRIQRSVNISEAAPVFPSYRSALRRTLLLLALLPALCGLTACSRFRHKPAANFVYVNVKQAHLNDRIAAVSTRTATVTNGQRLQVLQRGRNYLQVKTDQGAIGWIREKDTATAVIAAAFDSLTQAHAADPVIATAVVLDEVSMHITAGRETQKLYLLEEGDKLKLLERATLPKVALPGAVTPKPPAASEPDAASAAAPPTPDLPPVVMEDWWLVRDAQGHTGWVLSHMMDVDSPDAITQYAENMRVVSAAVLTTVYDPGADSADKNVPVYVVAYAPYKAGLPYDFDQVRVFTWNKAKHRYETAYRESNVEGFLPLVTGSAMATDIAGTKLAASLGNGPLPTFTYKILAGGSSINIDPVTGIPQPGQLIEKDFRLEGTYVRRVLLPGQTNTMPQAHPEPDPDKKKSAAKKRR